MGRAFQHIDMHVDGDIYTVAFREQRPDDPTVRAAAEEVESLIADDGCRKLIFRLGSVVCLYSVLIARLIKLRRTLAEHGGRFMLCEVCPQVMTVFESCQLQDYFEFHPDVAGAVEFLEEILLRRAFRRSIGGGLVGQSGLCTKTAAMAGKVRHLVPAALAEL